MHPIRPLVGLFLAFSLVLSSGAAPRIALVLKGHGPFWSEVQKGAVEAGARLGAEIIVKAPPTEADVSIQIALVRALAGQKLQALIIAATNKDALAAPVAALAATGVKIIAIDSPLSGSSATVFVGTDQKAAGEAAGALVAELVGDSSEVAILKHDQIGGAAGLRDAGALEKIKSLRPKVTVYGDIYASTEEGHEAERAALLLDKYPRVSAIYANGASGTAAMLKLLTNRKLTGSIKLVGSGFNLDPTFAGALKDGTMAGWIAQLPEDVGARSVETAVALINGQSVPAEVLTGFLTVTAKNLDDPKVRALPNL